MAKAPISFREFDELGEVQIYDHGILPHWRQSGCAYFVTFRLADSIPAGVLREIEHDRCLWLEARGVDPNASGWKNRFAQLPREERRQYERLVGRLLNQSLDECHGNCVLRDSAIAEMVATALDFFHGKRVFTGDFVVMPNHVHALMTPIEGYELQDVLQSIKSYTANRINSALQQTGQLWQRESHDHIVRDAEQLEAYQVYIAANPDKANLRPHEYVSSTATYIVDQ